MNLSLNAENRLTYEKEQIPKEDIVKESRKIYKNIRRISNKGVAINPNLNTVEINTLEPSNENPGKRYDSPFTRISKKETKVESCATVNTCQFCNVDKIRFLIRNQTQEDPDFDENIERNYYNKNKDCFELYSR